MASFVSTDRLLIFRLFLMARSSLQNAGRLADMASPTFGSATRGTPHRHLCRRRIPRAGTEPLAGGVGHYSFSDSPRDEMTSDSPSSLSSTFVSAILALETPPSG